MRKLKNLIGLFFSLLLIISCSGETDENELIEIKLSAEKYEVISDGKDKVVFKVLLNGDDITDKVVIVNADTEQPVIDGSFSTLEPGVFKFYAVKGDIKSNYVTITAEKGESPIEYKRRMIVFKFTGTWCSFCPAGGNKIDYWLDKPKYSNGQVIAFHGGSDKEPMLIPETDYLFSQVFKFTGGYPAAAIDMRDKAESTNMSTAVQEGLDRSNNEFPAYFSVSVSSKTDDAKSIANVGVEVNSSVTDEYNVVVYVVENGLIYDQLMNGVTMKDYQHNHVVRRLVSKTVYGDSMGKVAAGSKAAKNYEIQLDSKWNPENLYIYALIISGKTGYIHNLAYCKVIDGFMNSED